MRFADIIGHDDTKQTLVRAVQTNHLAHALLFDGRTGSANLALALALATYVNCENRNGGDSLFGNTGPATDACGQCASCAKMARLVHPDLHMVFPVANLGKGKNTSESLLTEWRKFLIESPYRTLTEWLDATGGDNKQANISAEEARNILQKLSLKSYEGGYKIMLIWLPELMNVTSANALLKVLEEPPERTLFLLVTNQPDKLLITILSRTQRVAVGNFSDTEVATYLRQTLNFDETRARRVAYLVDGDLAEAMRMAQTKTDEGATNTQHTWFADWMRACYRQDLTYLVKQADEFDKLPKERQKGLFDYSLRLCRDLFLWQQGAEQLLRLPDDELNFVRNFGKVLRPDLIERMVGDINEAAYHLERNARAKMILLDMSLTFTRLIK
ncbi:DNA polymerase III gamma/tau subunits-like protein [Fibrella aestuarina BUZ 2]|uniref:DNA polymerase III gamma/tau subunits-like protein n=1 Tax=Fibrella aestuarina BUZ 2 TaxID=1166018 RepID=I0K2C2_9BACT|nr:DNA polymerase III gamma/tau subunits-like protein [Fibrella aestuarina]CCG98275.1 DNA polymerase III gamma/tau subunits-like protein [Fibrella aestuarina BUZ 2]